jgi:Zn finger protein HypA/HybF involved in hydrogenase expression
VALIQTNPTDSHTRQIERPAPQVVRCECERCGSHTNAMRTFRVTGSCPNCGSFELTPIEGADPLDGPIAA